MMSDKVTIGLVQINNSFSGQNYLPYSIGSLESYARRHARNPERLHFLPQIFKRIPIYRIVNHLESADIAGFSTYVWNIQISLEAARRLKERRPDILIIFGGPQIPDPAEEFMRQHPFIDLAVHNEGERVFTELLGKLESRDWHNLPSLSFIDSEGRYVRTPNAQRIKDLSEIPSSFLNGVFDHLIATNPQEQWIGLWETNRGCPFSCTYCDWGSAVASKVGQFEMDRLKAEVDWFAKNKIDFVFSCDANFGIFQRDIEISRYVADVKQKTGYPKALSVQNTKNATERAYQTQKILADAGLNKGVTLSMQTLSMDVLRNIKRDNISLETYFELQRRFTRDKVETYSDLILALPGETVESYIAAIDQLIEAGQHNRIQFNNLSILPNAEMGDPAYQKKFGMVTVKSRIINFHGSLEESDDDVPEEQLLVVATDAMPADDWRRARAISWMTSFLHFDKLLQIPLIVAHHMGGLRYRDMLAAFMAVDRSEFPVLGEIRDFFESEARSIQNGGPEYVYSKEWLGIFWPADEYMYIKLTAEQRMQQFYHEAEQLMTRLAAEAPEKLPPRLLEDTFRLNRELVSRPFAGNDITVDIDYDILSYWQAARQNEPQPMRREPTRVVVRRSKSRYDNFSDWCREVVWWGNKKGAYLYTSESAEMTPELAGHY